MAGPAGADGCATDVGGCGRWPTLARSREESSSSLSRAPPAGPVCCLAFFNSASRLCTAPSTPSAPPEPAAGAVPFVPGAGCGSACRTGDGVAAACCVTAAATAAAARADGVVASSIVWARAAPPSRPSAEDRPRAGTSPAPPDAAGLAPLPSRPPPPAPPCGEAAASAWGVTATGEGPGAVGDSSPPGPPAPPAPGRPGSSFEAPHP